ncbi:DUF4249 domain-containing protein [Hymenobacter algoricola]|uniref:DUF4249 domain-containing protein n=1 Tax=Hymenobacter algoricola TaxID=486267 RepID=A0ABP7MXC2_9BACT
MNSFRKRITSRCESAAAFVLVLGLLLAVAGCGALQNDANVPLPNYPPQLVTECYLEDGQVPRLAVTESVPYLNNNQAPPAGSQAIALPNGQRVLLPTDVTVTLILADGSRRNLPFQPGVDARTNRFYTHGGGPALVAPPGATFALEVRDQRGRTVTGTATVPTRVPIDSVDFEFNQLTGANRKAYLLTNFRDPPGVGNYYRLLVHKSNVRTLAEVDYDVQDRFNDGRPFTLGTGYDFASQDTLIATLYHLDPAYYQFRASTNEAINANGNPFAQPSSIRSTVQGGLGVFTVLSYDRRQVILP